MTAITEQTAKPYADGHCRTCGETIGPENRCACWSIVADTLQRYLGMDFDGAAQMAADLWADADKAFVWSGEHAETHDVTLYPAPPELAALQAQDKLDYPHDEDCPRCGRRQYTAEPGPEVTGDEYETLLSTCQHCGWVLQ